MTDNKKGSHQDLSEFEVRQDVEGCPPLHRAAEAGDLGVVADLIKSGTASIEQKNLEHKTALQVAAEADQDHIVSYLLDHGADIAVDSIWDRSPLFLASKMGKRKAVKVLLDRGAAIDSAYSSALHSAASSDCPELIGDFLNAGADLNATDSEDCTPLHFVKSPDMVSAIVSMGAAVDVKNVDGMTPLLKVCNENPFNCLEIVASLVSNHADINVGDNGGWTPLHISCKNGYSEIVSVLLENGADLNCRNKAGQTPLHVAFKFPNIFELLCEKGANIFARSRNKKEPLHVVLENGNYECLAYLLKKGVYVDSRDSQRRTALHLASKNSFKNMVILLLESGADVNLRSSDFADALDYSKIYAKNKCLEDYLLHYVVMMKSLNLPLSEDLLRRVEFEGNKLGETESQELAKLKLTSIGSSQYTFEHFLKVPINSQLARMIKKNMAYFVSESYKNEFPNYSVLISNQLNKGIYRGFIENVLTGPCSLIFHGLIQDCTREILSYLNIDELVNFSNGLSEVIGKF